MSIIEPSVISERAYSIWEREGRPDGQALNHWLQAEAELKRTERAPESPAPRLDAVASTVAAAAKAAAVRTPRKRSARKS
jgi:hypothetical protein